MKLRIIYTFFAFAFGAFLLMSSSQGRATAANEGNTGAPNDNSSMNRTCQTCHNDGSFSVTPVLEFIDPAGNLVSNNTFENGITYTVKMTVNSTGSPGGYGFQMVALNAADGADGTPINTWAVPSGSDNVQVATIGNGRQYAEQKGVSNGNEFVMEWTADMNGPVTFYYGANAINDNSMISGDNATMASVQYSTLMSSTNELENNIALDVFPNPVADVINLRSTAQESKILDLFLYDVNGQQISTQKLNVPTGENVTPIQVADLPTGIYNLILSDGKNQIAKKVVKL